MSRGAALLTAIVLVALTGAVHGVRTERWAVSNDLRDASALLAHVPMNFGDWEGHARELDKRQFEAAGIVGHVMRVYQNRKTQAVVQVLVVCGRPGRISVHTPDVCFAGIGYKLNGNTAGERAVRRGGRALPVLVGRLREGRRRRAVLPADLLVLERVGSLAGARQPADRPRRRPLPLQDLRHPRDDQPGRRGRRGPGRFVHPGPASRTRSGDRACLLDLTGHPPALTVDGPRLDPRPSQASSGRTSREVNPPRR